MDVPTLKKAMVAYAKKHSIPTPSILDVKSKTWGDGAKKLAWRITGHLGWKQSTAKSVALQKAMADFAPVHKAPAVAKPKFVILHDHHAYHHSGDRFGSAIKWIVLHDMESGNFNGAAEAVADWFASKASGGSTHYGVDNNSIQQYLNDDIIPWGAPNANTNGIHIEQMGLASWNSEKWKTKAKGTLERTAWLIKHESKEHNVPIVFLKAHDLRAGKRGVTTHAQATIAFGGSHTDPGTGYPIAYVLDLAKKS